MGGVPSGAVAGAKIGLQSQSYTASGLCALHCFTMGLSKNPAAAEASPKEKPRAGARDLGGSQGPPPKPGLAAFVALWVVCPARPSREKRRERNKFGPQQVPGSPFLQPA